MNTRYSLNVPLSPSPYLLHCDVTVILKHGGKVKGFVRVSWEFEVKVGQPFQTHFHYGEKLKPGMEVEHQDILEWVFQWMFADLWDCLIGSLRGQRLPLHCCREHKQDFPLCVCPVRTENPHTRMLPFLSAYISESRNGRSREAEMKATEEKRWMQWVKWQRKTWRLSNNHLLALRLLTINVHVLYFQPDLLDELFRMLWQLAKDESHIKSSISLGCNSWRWVGDSRLLEKRQTFCCTDAEFRVSPGDQWAVEPHFAQLHSLKNHILDHHDFILSFSSHIVHTSA